MAERVKPVVQRVARLGIVPSQVLLFVVLGGSSALCQQAQLELGSKLPSAPSVQYSAHSEKSPTLLLPVGGEVRESGNDAAGRALLSRRFQLLYRDEQQRTDSANFFERYFYPALLTRNLDYHPSTSSSLMGRATYAASRIFVRRDESGKGRLNSSYFVSVLSMAVVHVANRPYWNRSAGAPFSDFGSTIGNDAGMNLLHEFRPGLEQIVRNHTPRFVARIEERVGR